MTAKERFQLNEIGRARFKAIIEDPLVEQAMDAAVLELINSLPKHDSEVINNNNFHKVIGARAFVSILQNLAVKPEPVTRSAIGTLKEQ